MKNRNSDQATDFVFYNVTTEELICVKLADFFKFVFREHKSDHIYIGRL